jgi:hypothetical protein
LHFEHGIVRRMLPEICLYSLENLQVYGICGGRTTFNRMFPAPPSASSCPYVALFNPPFAALVRIACMSQPRPASVIAFAQYYIEFFHTLVHHQSCCYCLSALHFHSLSPLSVQPLTSGGAPTGLTMRSNNCTLVTSRGCPSPMLIYCRSGGCPI